MSNAAQTRQDKVTAVNRRFRPASGCAILMWLLSILFAARVLGQAIQRWMPQSFLPAFDDFQGSNLPYWLLLSSQLVIFSVMVRFSWRTQTGKLIPNPLAGRLLIWGGAVYMIGSLARLAIGFALPDPAAWFTAWIPAIFHVVLAGFVLTLAAYHRRGADPTPGEARK